MSFAEKYVRSLTSTNLRDDEFHGATVALMASALADKDSSGLGALLCRVKYADGTINRMFEGNAGNLAQLLRIWVNAVTVKGQDRGWVKATTAWDAQAAHTLYRRVAEQSLMYWLDGKCGSCTGTGIAELRHVCTACKGTGQAEVTCKGGAFERERVMDMISELEALVQSHNSRAAHRIGTLAQAA